MIEENNINQLEDKIKNLEKTISQKSIPQEDKEKLLSEVEKLKKILKEKI